MISFIIGTGIRRYDGRPRPNPVQISPAGTPEGRLWLYGMDGCGVDSAFVTNINHGVYISCICLDGPFYKFST